MADHRHKRDTNARRKPKAMAVIGPLAVLATASSSTLGVLAAEPGRRPTWPRGAAAAVEPATADRGEPTGDPVRGPRQGSPRRRRRCHRRPSCPRPRSRPPIKGADKQLWTTDELNIWTQPGDKAKQLGELDAGKKVLVTGRALWGRTEIVLKGKSRWVTAGYLSDEKPPDARRRLHQRHLRAMRGQRQHRGRARARCAPTSRRSPATAPSAAAAATTAPAARSTSWSAASAAGRSRSSSARTTRRSASATSSTRQHIWSVERAGEGWRGMSDRGSTTANHYDHVHVTSTDGG